MQLSVHRGEPLIVVIFENHMQVHYSRVIDLTYFIVLIHNNDAIAQLLSDRRLLYIIMYYGTETNQAVGLF